MTLLLLLACGSVTEAHCEFEERAVGDEETLDFGMSIDDVLAELAVQSVEAIDIAGDPVVVDVRLARGEGPAQLSDAVVVEEVIRGAGPARKTTWLDDGTCADVVTVPMDLVLSGEDGAVAVFGPATLTNLADTFDPPTFAVEYTLSGADLLPAGTHGARTGGTVHLELREGAVIELRAEIETEDGARETVLWYAEAF